MKKVKLQIQGMTCKPCETTLEQAVKRLNGVSEAKADYVNGSLSVSYRSPCDPQLLKVAIEETGHSVAEVVPKQTSGIFLLIMVLGLFVIGQQMGVGQIFQHIPIIPDDVSYAALLLIGVMTSVHCVAMCGGFNLGQSMVYRSEKRWKSSLLYNFGRLTSYTTIGAMLGLIGQAAAITLRVRTIIGLAAGIMMAIMGVNMLFHIHPLRKLALRLPKSIMTALAKLGNHGPFAFGLVNGFMPCGPLQSLQLFAIASGSVLKGALSLLFFCLGTIPLLMGLGSVVSSLKAYWRQRITQFSAALLVVLGLIMIHNNAVLAGMSMQTSALDESAVVSEINGDKQYITTNLHMDGYDDIQLTAGIPAVWTIYAEKDTLTNCNRTIVLPEFDLEITLTEGKNEITFTPGAVGTYTYSCWMGMLNNTITVMEQHF